MKTKVLTVEQRMKHLDEFTKFHAEFYSEYPYLRTPNVVESRSTMKKFLSDPRVVVTSVYDKRKLVAASISIPLTQSTIAAHLRKYFFEQKLVMVDYVDLAFVLVSPDYRSKGVGKQLLQDDLDELTRLGYKGRVTINIFRQPNDPKNTVDYVSSRDWLIKLGHKVMSVTKLRIPYIDIGDTELTTKEYEFLMKVVK